MADRRGASERCNGQPPCDGTNAAGCQPHAQNAKPGRRAHGAEITADLARLQSEGLGVRAIARQTRVPLSTVSVILRRSRDGAVGGDRGAAGRVRATQALAIAAALRPRWITAEPGTPRWFLENALGARAAGRKIGKIARGCPGLNTPNQTTRDETSGVRSNMIANQLLADYGVALTDPDVVAEIAFALGEREANERVRTILADDQARAHPFTALRLALDSTLPADEVLGILAGLPPERADRGGENRPSSLADSANPEGTP